MTLIASNGERIGFYEAARQHDQLALDVIVSILKDDNQPPSLRLAAANDLLDRAYGRPPLAVEVGQRQAGLQKVIPEVRWLPPDPDDHSRVIEPEPDF